MKNLTTLILLLTLTALAAVAANLTEGSHFITFVILTLAMIKALLVAFQFMELKKAHFFWKSSVVTALALILTVFAVLLF